MNHQAEMLQAKCDPMGSHDCRVGRQCDGDHSRPWDPQLGSQQYGFLHRLLQLPFAMPDVYE